MSVRSAMRRILAQEDLNFLLSNRIPRLALSRFMGWFSKIEHPAIRVPSIALWRLFCDVDLTDAQNNRFDSLHAAFTRALKPGSRRFAPDPNVLASPCDAIVGATGRVSAGVVQQIKGFDYRLGELLGDTDLAEAMEGGCFVTLRLTAGMYHRFHAPHDLHVMSVKVISGDKWNVNPIALKRVERLYCKNERVPIVAQLAGGGERIVLVAVGAVLVSSVRLPFIDKACPVNERDHGPWGGSAHFAKGDEIGWFEHGSTIVVIAPEGHLLAQDVRTGDMIRAGEPLLVQTQGAATVGSRGRNRERTL